MSDYFVDPPINTEHIEALAKDLKTASSRYSGHRLNEFRQQREADKGQDLTQSKG